MKTKTKFGIVSLLLAGAIALTPYTAKKIQEHNQRSKVIVETKEGLSTILFGPYGTADTNRDGNVSLEEQGTACWKMDYLRPSAEQFDSWIKQKCPYLPGITPPIPQLFKGILETDPKTAEKILNDYRRYFGEKSLRNSIRKQPKKRDIELEVYKEIFDILEGVYEKNKT